LSEGSLGDHGNPFEKMHVDTEKNNTTEASEYAQVLFSEATDMPSDQGDELQGRLDHLVNQMDEPTEHTVPAHLAGTPASIPILMLKIVLGFVCGAGLALWIIWPADVTLETPLPVADVVMHDAAIKPISPPKLIDASKQASTSFEVAPKKQGLQKPKPVQPSNVVLTQPKSSPKAKSVSRTPVMAVNKSMPKKKSLSGSRRLIVHAMVGNIRSMPDTSARVLYRLKKGAIVTRLEIKGEWRKVRLRNGVIAWAHQSIF